jgi:hypothetical protein
VKGPFKDLMESSGFEHFKWVKSHMEVIYHSHWQWGTKMWVVYEGMRIITWRFHCSFLQGYRINTSEVRLKNSQSIRCVPHPMWIKGILQEEGSCNSTYRLLC